MTTLIKQGNTGESNQVQSRQGDTGDAHEEGSVMRDKRKARRDFKIKQVTQDMALVRAHAYTHTHSNVLHGPFTCVPVNNN